MSAPNDERSSLADLVRARQDEAREVAAAAQASRYAGVPFADRVAALRILARYDALRPHNPFEAARIWSTYESEIELAQSSLADCRRTGIASTVAEALQALEPHLTDSPTT